jgi:hypothetical protein
MTLPLVFSQTTNRLQEEKAAGAKQYQSVKLYPEQNIVTLQKIDVPLAGIKANLRTHALDAAGGIL